MSDSMITKKAIANALKSLIHTKSFDKISISDITKTCGLNNKYELLTWIYYTEGFSYIVDGISFENWDQKILLQALKTAYR